MPAANSSEVGQELQELLGKAGSGLPVWLSPDKFLLPDFDPESCIADLRRYVPLATLQVELQTYLGLLKNKLVDVINEDYSAYVSLSSKLSNVDGAVLRMRKPLLELKEKSSVVQEAVKGELAALNQGLKRRKEIATARSLLELLQEIAHVASKVEKLLSEVAALPETKPTSAEQTDDGAGASGYMDLDSQSRLLERVANEVSRLTFLAARGKDLAFVKGLLNRITTSRQLVLSRLNDVLAGALQGALHTPALHALNAYVELGEAAAAETVLRRVAVAPLVERVVEEHKASRPRVGAQREEGLPQLLPALLAALRRELGPLLAAALSPTSALKSIDLLGSVIVAEVGRVIAEKLPGVFSPGVPSAFHANYSTYLRFLGELEGLAQVRRVLDRARSSAAYASFTKRWNTSVYFSLIYQEIAGELEDALTSPSLEAAAAPQDSPYPAHLAATVTLIRCLQRCISTDIYLSTLADKFLRLALQCIARYVHWVTTLASARRDIHEHGPSGPAPIHHSPSNSSIPPSFSNPDLSTTVGRGPPAPPPVALTWVGGVALEELAAVNHECEVLDGFLAQQLVPGFDALLRDAGNADTVELVEGTLKSASTELISAASALLQVICSELTERCVVVVRQLKGITATYRVSSKGPPSRHSHYVTGVMTPLRSFLESERSRLSPASRTAVLINVIGSVASRYAALAEELLTGVRKTELSLKRLKKARPGEGDASGDAGGMSDSDKVALQLHLDVEEFGRQIHALGIKPASLDEYVHLSEAVGRQPTSAGATHALGVLGRESSMDSTT